MATTSTLRDELAVTGRSLLAATGQILLSANTCLPELDDLDDDLTIYTAISPSAAPDTAAEAAADVKDGDTRLPVGAIGTGYFLNVPWPGRH